MILQNVTSVSSGERGEVRVHHLARAARLRRDLNRNLEKAAVVSAGSSRASVSRSENEELFRKKKSARVAIAFDR
jgi:hypothetical protein